MSKIRVGLIFGGRSAEHEVSLMSARSVLAAIDKNKYDVTLIGITRAGRWLAGGDPLMALTAPGQEPGSASAALEVHVASSTSVQHLPEELGALDVVFPLLHGPYGEDGTVQGLLELADLPYVGSGVLGSALAMDKDIAKRLLRAEGIPVVDWDLVRRAEIVADLEAVVARVEARFAYPVFTKPANLGSSVGVVKAHDRAELTVALRESAQYDRRVLVEPGVDAREIEVSVLGNDDPVASVPGEIVPSREFYDYAAKYLDDASGLLIPAPIAAETAETARTLAVKAFRALECAGLARVDFLLDRGNGNLFVNEINTIPGFTAISMYPKLWAASGLEYSELIDRLIALALERQAEKNGNAL
ncbi:MAG TPA: D-alanine--D-alanine ligase family protein [Anaerolineales bacterium]|nr:D-alanine--D-alanine ligase family protein [Anaerolineales bacterium]